jgi:hypothetical protein
VESNTKADAAVVETWSQKRTLQATFQEQKSKDSKNTKNEKGEKYLHSLT